MNLFPPSHAKMVSAALIGTAAFAMMKREKIATVCNEIFQKGRQFYEGSIKPTGNWLWTEGKQIANDRDSIHGIANGIIAAGREQIASFLPSTDTIISVKSKGQVVLTDIQQKTYRICSQIFDQAKHVYDSKIKPTGNWLWTKGIELITHEKTPKVVMSIVLAGFIFDTVVSPDYDEHFAKVAMNLDHSFNLDSAWIESQRLDWKSFLTRNS